VRTQSIGRVADQPADDLAASETKTSSSQYILGGLSLILGLLPILKHRTEDIPYDLLASTIGLVGLLFCIWLEHAKVRRLVDMLNSRTTTSEQRVLEQFSGRCADLTNAFDRRTKGILELLKIDHELAASEDKYLKTLRILLAPPESGMARVKKDLIIYQALDGFNRFHLNLDKPNTEKFRMLQLKGAIQHADKYAYACTYCDPMYVIHFWKDTGESELEEYYRAHATAVHKSRDRVQRVFVTTKELRADPKAFGVFIEVLKKLRGIGMTCIFEIGEDLALPILGGKKYSFFVADDEFVSESFAYAAPEDDGRPGDVSGWIAFDAREAQKLRPVFERLRESGDQITDARIREFESRYTQNEV
jgi:hypothetical protein